MLGAFKNCIVAFLGWLIFKLIDEAGAVKHINRVQEKLKSGDANCSIQLALLVTDSKNMTCLFDLTHRRFLTCKVGQQFTVKGGYGFAFDEGGLNQANSPEMFRRRFSQVLRYAMGKQFG